MNSLKLSVVLVLYLLSGAFAAVAGEGPGASAIASTNRLAAAAGRKIIENGGNAFDAAVAITAVLAVTEPYSSGLGGGGIWLLSRAGDGRQVMIDGLVTAPEFAHRRLYEDRSIYRDRQGLLYGPLAAGIPGIPAGIVHMAKNYGVLPLKESLGPAVIYAEKGFRVDDHYLKRAGLSKNNLIRFHEAAKTFLDRNEVPRNGHVIRQQQLADAFKLLGKAGHDGFYAGELAATMVHEVNKHGGVWTIRDLENYSVQERATVSISYHGMKVITVPPPSSGGIVLGQALKMLSHFDIDSMDSVSRRHHVIEALRRAYRDSAVYSGDPRFTDVPVARLLNDDYLEGLALTIDPDTATPSGDIGDTGGLVLAGSQTTHFSVIDSAGNMVAGTLSLNSVFGSGFVPAGTGILLNNGMNEFSFAAGAGTARDLIKNNSNAIQSGKRPVTYMTPAFFETGDRVAVVGTPGGVRIPSMVLLAALDFVDGNPPASWFRLPRYHHEYLPDIVEFEYNGLSFKEQRRLHDMGHKLHEDKSTYGNMQAVMWNRNSGRVLAASDPRGEGVAIVFPEQD